MAKKNISPNYSFKGWKIWEFIKGRKKTLITTIGMVGSFLALDPNLVSLLAGGAVFEGIYSLAEYFLSEVKN